MKLLLTFVLMNPQWQNFAHDMWTATNHVYLLEWLERQPGPNGKCSPEYRAELGPESDNEVNCDGRLQIFL